MSSIDPDPIPEADPAGAGASARRVSPATGPGGVAGAAQASSSRLWLLALVAGLGAGIMAWLGGEAAHDVFRPAAGQVRLMGMGLVTTVTPATKAAADLKNVALASSLWGAALGLALGLAGGLTRRSPAAATGAALAGLVLGGVVGLGAALALVSIYYRFYRDAAPDGLTGPMLIHAALWSALGAAGGWALGLGLGRDRAAAGRALLGGLVGAALGAVVYELVGAWAFPLARTYQPQATAWGARLLAALGVAIGAAAGAAMAVTDPRHRVP